MTLRDLTSDDVTAILALDRVGDGEGDDDDIILCDKRGWLNIDHTEVSDRLCWSSTGCDDSGRKVLEDARRIASEMTEEMRVMLVCAMSGLIVSINDGEGKMLHGLGLLGDYGRMTPAGCLVGILKRSM